MLEYRRYRDAAAHLAELFAEGRRYLYRSAPLPPELRRVALDAARPAYEPDLLGVSIGDLLRVAAGARHQPHPPDRLARARGCGSLRELLAGARLARLRRELRRRGQAHPGGDAVRAARAPQARRGDLGAGRGRSGRSRSRESAATASGEWPMSSLEQVVEALLFLSPEPVSTGRARRGVRGDRGRGRPGARPARRRARRAAALVLREVARRATRSPRTRTPTRRRAGCWRKPRTPPLTQAQAETLAIVAYLQPVSRPEIARIRGVSSESAVQTLTERGLIEESGPLALRRRHPPHDAAVRAPLRALAASTRCRTRRGSTRRPRTRPSCASGC